MKLILEIVGFVLLVAWIIDYFTFRREREMARKQREGGQRWWKDTDDLGDH